MELKNLRIQNKKTQQEIAKMINISQSTYNYYELDKCEPSIDTLKKLADYYNVSLDYLCGRKYMDNIGYLNEQQKNLIILIKKLNQINLIKVGGYIAGLLANQN